MQRPSVSTSDGFTLLEVLVSLTIMAIVLVAVFRMHAQSLSMDAVQRFHIVASQLSQTKLSEIKATLPGELHSESGEFGEPFKGYQWETGIEDVETDRLGDTGSQLKKISIDILYGANRHRHNLTTYHFFQ